MFCKCWLKKCTILLLTGKEAFRTSSWISHAGLVNEQWDFGNNGRSLKYVECCLQNFPGFGVLGPEGDPISWIVKEQSCEMRMGYTVPKYRDHGYMKKIGFPIIKYFIQKKMPFYFHASKDKTFRHWEVWGLRLLLVAGISGNALLENIVD